MSVALGETNKEVRHWYGDLPPMSEKLARWNDKGDRGTDEILQVPRRRYGYGNKC